MSTSRRLLLVCTLAFGGLLLGHTVDAATLSVSPATGSYSVGQTITATVRVNSSTQAMNAAEATLLFSSDTLSLKSISKSGSILEYWTTQPSGSTASGRVVFSGGLPTPGYKGSSGTILQVAFTVVKTGTGTLSLTGGSVLANDGLGTNILTGQGSAFYTLTTASVTPTPTPTPEPAKPTTPTPTVTCDQYPDQNLWYQATRLTCHWNNPNGMQGVSYAFTAQADSVPDETLEANVPVDITIPADGIWYFHLRAQYATGWSNTLHYAVRHDTTKPDPFALEVVRDRGESDPSPIVQFHPTDSLSGVARTTITIDDGQPYDAASPATLMLAKAGLHTITVTAYDAAGNSQSSKTTLTVVGYPVPIITSVSSPIILLQPIHVTGLSAAGDVVSLYIEGTLVGRFPVGTAHSAATVGSDPVRLPWEYSIDRLLKPGTYSLTAVATHDGQESVETDPISVKVNGTEIMVGGRQIATIAFAPLAFIVTIVSLVVVLLIVVDLCLWAIRMRRRAQDVNQSLERLRQRVKRERVGAAELDDAIERIEERIVKKRKRS